MKYIKIASAMSQSSKQFEYRKGVRINHNHTKMYWKLGPATSVERHTGKFGTAQKIHLRNSAIQEHS